MTNPQTTKTLWFAELEGETLAICDYTKRGCILEIMDGYTDRSWNSLKRGGYSVAKYKIVRQK